MTALTKAEPGRPLSPAKGSAIGFLVGVVLSAAVWLAPPGDYSFRVIASCFVGLTLHGIAAGYWASVASDPRPARLHARLAAILFLVAMVGFFGFIPDALAESIARPFLASMLIGWMFAEAAFASAFLLAIAHLLRWLTRIAARPGREVAA